MDEFKSNVACLVLAQYRETSKYNDFVGKFYHFPQKYLNLLSSTPIEFVYYEPKKNGNGEYFGYGKIEKKPFEDKREPGYFFVEISGFKPFTSPVPFDSDKGPRETSPFYNAQNSVRRIHKENLDEICLDGGVQLNFESDAHLIKVLGEQLIASEKVGILELIKNAYDADAGKCRLRIEKVPSLPQIDECLYEFNEYQGPVIVVEDNGIGMTKEVIEKGWLRPASTIKTNIKEKLKRERQKAMESGTLGAYDSLVAQLKKEYKNRIPLGEKGVGRFATHRLGKHLIIKTKVADLDYEYLLRIDWEKFDQISDKTTDLNSIGIRLTRQAPSRDYGERNSGTQLIIFGGKDGFSWDEKTIRDLNNSILRLNSPNPNPSRSSSEFYALLECPQLIDMPDSLIADDFKPVFTLEGLVDENGVIDYSLRFTPPPSVPMSEEIVEDSDYDLKVCEIHRWKNPKTGNTRKPKCGAFYIHLDAWYRTKPWLDGPNGNQFERYLDDFGGISIYREGINIFPAEWGAETDWLGLKSRHIKKGWNISYYNLVGNIEIDQANNLDLVDKTDREGLIKNEASQDLAALVQTVIISILETKFKGVRDTYKDLTGGIIRDPKELKNATKLNAKVMGAIRTKYPIEDDPYFILETLGEPEVRGEKLVNLEKSIKNLHKSLDLIEGVQDRLSEQAGFGLAIAVSIHEIAKITSNFYTGFTEMLKKGRPDEIKLKEMRESSASLRSELTRLSPLRAIRSEKRREFNVLKSLKYVYSIQKSKLKNLGIEVNLPDENSDFSVYTRFGVVNQIFSNLFDNSIYWLDTLDKNKIKKIEIKFDKKYRSITFADSGPGIHDSIRSYLFQPGYSMKIPPSGLGLYISKSYMHSMKGDIYLTVRSERMLSLPGAQFTLDFADVPARKEEAK